jgi:predicted hydrocarbon binding protein
MPSSPLADRPAVPPPWRHSRYAPAAFFRPSVSDGIITDALGRRTILSPAELLAAIRDALVREVGDAANEIEHKIGSACGSADMHSFMNRSTDEFGIELAKVHMGVALATWWWAWSAGGWGSADFHLQHVAQRLVRIDVGNSVTSGEWRGSSKDSVSDSSLGTRYSSLSSVRCHWLAGLFAGSFGQLSGRNVACVEVQCRGAGATDCRFLATTRSQAESAASWRDAGIAADEIERRLLQATAAAVSGARRP